MEQDQSLEEFVHAVSDMAEDMNRNAVTAVKAGQNGLGKAALKVRKSAENR